MTGLDAVSLRIIQMGRFWTISSKWVPLKCINYPVNDGDDDSDAEILSCECMDIL